MEVISSKRTYHCSYCGKQGHKKNSCPNNIDYFDTNIMNKETSKEVREIITTDATNATIDEDFTLLKPNPEDKKDRIMKKIVEGIQNDISPSNTDVWLRNKNSLTFHVSTIKEAQNCGINRDYLNIYLDMITDMDEINI
jgi:hypothetical protein